MSGIGNRSEAERQAIAESMELGEEGEGKEAKLSSRFIYAAEGLPDDPALVAAINEWADVWGEEVVTLVNHEGLLDDEISEQAEARKKLTEAADKIAELLPSSKFGTGEVFFDGGYVQLSAP